jgi:hypothetical protein
MKKLITFSYFLILLLLVLCTGCSKEQTKDNLPSDVPKGYVMFDRKTSNRAAKILVQEVKLREKITIIDYDGWNNTDRIQ